MIRLAALLIATGLAVASASESVRPESQRRGSPGSTEASFGLQRFTLSVYPNMVAATGSWIADSPGPIADSPIQTSDLSCFRDRKECVEARAFLNEATNHLLVTTTFYEIKQWTETEVVAESSFGRHGNAIQIRFDLVRRAVRMTEARLPPDAPRSARSRYDAHLDDGDKVKRGTGK